MTKQSFFKFFIEQSGGVAAKIDRNINFPSPMNLKPVLTSLVTQLASWETLNEAQTRQALVLRILAALGYDIWNPLEVVAEQNSGGGLGSYVPDFTITLSQRNCFIIEIKPLGKSFSSNDKTQVVNYVNSKGLRWAVLTNGKEWLWFDNHQAGEAATRLAFAFTLEDQQAFDYFEQLLSPAVWKQSPVNDPIEQNIQFAKLLRKLCQVMREEGFSTDDKGLRAAIKYTLHDEEERQLANNRFAELSSRLLSIPAPPPEVSSQIDILQLLRDKIAEASSQFSKQSVDLKLKINQLPVSVKNWHDIYLGLVETCLGLDKDLDIKLYDDPTQKGRYRLLSNGKYLYINLSAKNQQQLIHKLLKILQLPKGILEITYQGKIFCLP